MPNGVNEKTRLSLPWIVALSMVTGAISATVTATTAVYGMRDRVLEKTHAQITQESANLRNERAEVLKHYVTREAWLEWRQQERIRQDRQFYELLGAIQKVRR